MQQMHIKNRRATFFAGTAGIAAVSVIAGYAVNQRRYIVHHNGAVFSSVLPDTPENRRIEKRLNLLNKQAHRGLVLIEQGKPQAAKREFLKTTKMGSHGGAEESLGDIYLDEQNYVAAAWHYDNFVWVNLYIQPTLNAPGVYFKYALALAETGRYEDAYKAYQIGYEQCYRRPELPIPKPEWATRRGKRDLEVAAYLCLNEPVRSDDHNKTAREKRLQRALTLNPHSPDLYLTLANNLWITGRPAEAIAAAQKSIALCGSGTANAGIKSRAQTFRQYILPTIQEAQRASERKKQVQQAKAG